MERLIVEIERLERGLKDFEENVLEFMPYPKKSKDFLDGERDMLRRIKGFVVNLPTIDEKPKAGRLEIHNSYSGMNKAEFLKSMEEEPVSYEALKRIERMLKERL